MVVKICDIGSCRIITGEATEWATLVGTVPFRTVTDSELQEQHPLQ